MAHRGKVDICKYVSYMMINRDKTDTVVRGKVDFLGYCMRYHHKNIFKPVSPYKSDIGDMSDMCWSGGG
jgi:hypothetical protein